MKNLIKRALSGAIYIALIVGAILWGTIPFLVLTAVFTLVAVVEFSKVMHSPSMEESDGSNTILLDVIGALLIVAVPSITYHSQLALPALFSVLTAYTLSRGVCALYDNSKHALREAVYSVFGVIYTAIPMLMLNMLYASNPDTTKYIVLMMFVLIWLNDTGAYCVGMLFGRNRLFPRLSPKKSWEGFWGGLVCCIACGVACGYIFNLPGFPIGSWVALAVVTCIFSTWGDLFESLIKRTAGVKDSGNIIPGHGGILDRIDSLLFVAPCAYIVYFLSLL